MACELTIPLQIRVSVGALSPVAIPTFQRAQRPGVLAPGGLGQEDAGSIPHLQDFSAASLIADEFKYSTALSLALAARLAYESEADVKSIVENDWKLQNCEFIDLDETQCFVASSPDAELVSFRGTEALADWLTNLNLFSTTRSYGAVHRGFLGAFQVVEARLKARLDKHKGRPVLITGHSLGGALALIAAAEWHMKYNVTWVHTCGQPAVGFDDFQEFMEDNYRDQYFRFVNDDDVVPMVPPFFKHAGRLIHFAEDGDVENALNSPELESLGIELPPPMENTPMMSKDQFDLMRARLLQEQIQTGATPSDLSVQIAAQEAVSATGGLESADGLEGLFPSVSDHDMDTYVRKIARQAGV